MFAMTGYRVRLNDERRWQITANADLSVPCWHHAVTVTFPSTSIQWTPAQDHPGFWRWDYLQWNFLQVSPRAQLDHCIMLIIVASWLIPTDHTLAVFSILAWVANNGKCRLVSCRAGTCTLDFRSILSHLLVPPRKSQKHIWPVCIDLCSSFEEKVAKLENTW